MAKMWNTAGGIATPKSAPTGLNGCVEDPSGVSTPINDGALKGDQKTTGGQPAPSLAAGISFKD